MKQPGDRRLTRSRRGVDGLRARGGMRSRAPRIEKFRFVPCLLPPASCLLLPASCLLVVYRSLFRNTTNATRTNTAIHTSGSPISFVRSCSTTRGGWPSDAATVFSRST
jgi:hypothetical protein